MSFAVEKLLVGCSIKHVSRSLEMILEALANSGSLPSRVNVGKLLRTIITHSKHAKSVLHNPKLMQIPIEATNTMDCDIRTLLRLGCDIALRFMHDQVAEIHLLLAILESRPADIAAALSLVVAEHKKAYPNGTPRQQTMLAFAIAQGRTDWVDESRHRIEETPYSVGRIHDRVVEYLSSRYYPYRSLQWDEFQRDYPNNVDASGRSPEIQAARIRFLENGFGVSRGGSKR